MAAPDKVGRLDIACVAQSDSGHMNPMMLIVEGLAERGHRVRLLTFAFGAGKYAQRAKACGAEFVGLPCSKTEEDMSAESLDKGNLPFFVQRDQMFLPLLEALEREPPQLIVSDFSTLAAMSVAEKLGIQLAINMPAPLELCQAIFRTPDLRTLVAFGGFAFFWAPFKIVSLPLMFNVAGTRELADTIVHHAANALVLVNTFFGLEESLPLPPFVQLTGPLAPAPKAAAFDRTHPDLHRFLEGAGDVVYVTLGSMVRPEPHVVVAIFETMKLAGCHVIWSLKEDCQTALPVQNDPCFFVSSWLPQPALLCHPKVKAVVTHCGWGGVLECMQAGKPVVTLPFFGDQPMNADILHKAGAGLPLAPSPSFSADHHGIGCYAPGSIRPAEAAPQVRRVLQDPAFFSRAQRLRRLAAGPGLGRTAVCERLESAALDGVEHLTNPAKVRGVTRQQPALVTALLLGLAAAALAAAPRLLAARR